MPPSNMFLRGHEKPLAEINRDLLEAHWMSLNMVSRFQPLDGLQLFLDDDRIMPIPRCSLNKPAA